MSHTLTRTWPQVQPWISTVVRWVLGGIFVAAGALKVIDPQTSVQAVRAYQLVPVGMEQAVGWGLPFAEICLGLLLIAGIFTRTVAGVAVAVLVVFVAAVLSAAARGLSIDCGCFGGGGVVAAGETSYAAEVGRDLGFLVLAGWLVWRPQSRLGLHPSEEEPT